MEADAKDYRGPPPALLFEPGELHSRPFWKAGIAECMATFLFLYVIISTIIGVVKSPNWCAFVGFQVPRCNLWRGYGKGVPETRL